MLNNISYKIPATPKLTQRLMLLPRVFFVVASLGVSTVFAAGETSELETHFEQTTSFQYTAEGVTYLWGVGQNQVLDGFFYNGHRHSRIAAADQVEIKRVDIAGVATGEPCGVFAEFDGAVDELVTSYPLASNGNCDMAAMLAGRVINRGTLDTFTNTGPAPKNIERLDFIYQNGLLASVSDAGLDVGGHVVAEKRGNNPVQIAAITALDTSGEPSAYGPLIRIDAVGCSDPDVCYGVTAIRHEYSFLQSSSIAPQYFARRLSGDTENMAMAFISNRKLGLTAGQSYYGFSLFARDVDAKTHDLLNPSTFPQDTADNYIVEGDGADLYGGMASLYWDNSPAAEAGEAVYGDIYIDHNNNSSRDDKDVGLSAIQVSLFEDTNNNRSFDPSIDKKITIASSDSTGRFVFPGIVEGFYFAELDESSQTIPPGIALLLGSNPIGFDVIIGQTDGLNFAFKSMSGDGSVTAVADALTIRQDVSATIDVLANDIDPVGAGLSIGAASMPAYGTVSVVADQLSYTPSVGFNGKDSFSYTAVDANGGESTAAVAVNVLRFSDINNNGIDDYEECGCDDIRLITGVDGSGTGAGNALWFFALAFLWPWFNLLRQRQGESV